MSSWIFVFYDVRILRIQRIVLWISVQLLQCTNNSVFILFFSLLLFISLLQCVSLSLQCVPFFPLSFILCCYYGCCCCYTVLSFFLFSLTPNKTWYIICLVLCNVLFCCALTIAQKIVCAHCLNVFL